MFKNRDKNLGLHQELTDRIEFLSKSLSDAYGEIQKLHDENMKLTERLADETVERKVQSYIVKELEYRFLGNAGIQREVKP